MMSSTTVGSVLFGLWTMGYCFDIDTPPMQQSCLGYDVALPWNYTTDLSETLTNAFWFYYDEFNVKSTVMIQPAIPGSAFPTNARYMGRASLLSGYNAGLELQGVFPNDTGRYELEVNYVPGGPSKTNVLVSVYMIGVEIKSIGGIEPGGVLPVGDGQPVIVNLTTDALLANVTISWQGNDINMLNCRDTCTSTIDIDSSHTGSIDFSISAEFEMCGNASNSQQYAVESSTAPASTDDSVTPSIATVSITPASPATSDSTTDTTPSVAQSTMSTATGSTTGSTTAGTAATPDPDQQGRMAGWKIAIIVIVCVLVVVLIVFLIMWKRHRNEHDKHSVASEASSTGELQSMSRTNGTPLNTNQLGLDNKAYEQRMVEQKANAAQPTNANQYQPHQSLNNAPEEPKPDYTNLSTRVDPDPDYGRDDKIPNTFQNPDGSASVFVGQSPLQPAPDYPVNDPHVARAYSSGGGPTTRM